MKRRGLLTKLFLGSLAAPSVAKAVIEKSPRMDYELDPNITGFGLAQPKHEGAPIKFDNWEESMQYSKGDVVIDSFGRKFRVTTHSNSPITMEIS